jgi:hypothetical protein
VAKPFQLLITDFFSLAGLQDPFLGSVILS